MGSKAWARNVIERIVARFGYELRVAGTPPCGYEPFLRRIVAAGIQPATVFDVGVGTGTPWLYAAFPQAHFVLVEPQAIFEPTLKRLCASMDAEYHLVGVGESEKQLPLYKLPDSATGSSFLPPNAYNEQHWGKSECAAESLRIVPLDSFADRKAPFLLKIDTEGYELEVLRGSRKILEQTDVIVLEVGITQRQVGEPDLIEIGAFLKDAGFRLVDFPTLVQERPGGALVYADVALCTPGGSVFDVCKGHEA